MDVADRQLSIPTVRIEPVRHRLSIDMKPLWEYRNLLYFFTWRDLKVRYKQTVLGPAWAILQPLLATIVFTVFFGRVAHISSNGVPYLIFSFAGLLPWTFFSNAMTNGSNSLVASASMITKIYFPRIALPIAAVLGCAVDFFFSAIIVIPMMAWYGIGPSTKLLALPLFLLIASAAAFGMAFFLSALNVRYRDVKYVIPFMTQIWLFASPVVYSASSLHKPWTTLYALNPMVGVVNGFRWSILGTGPAPGLGTAASAATALVMLLGGTLYLQHVESSIADVI